MWLFHGLSVISGSPVHVSLSVCVCVCVYIFLACTTSSGVEVNLSVFTIKWWILYRFLSRGELVQAVTVTVNVTGCV